MTSFMGAMNALTEKIEALSGLEGLDGLTEQLTRIEDRLVTLEERLNDVLDRLPSMETWDRLEEQVKDTEYIVREMSSTLAGISSTVDDAEQRAIEAAEAAGEAAYSSEELLKEHHRQERLGWLRDARTAMSRTKLIQKENDYAF